jgi:hypothetical protein
MKETKGIIYISTGPKCNQEGIRSARSAKKYMPSLPIALFTDAMPNSCDLSLYDQVNILEGPQFSSFDKIRPLRSSPFLKTLFVDTDTLFIESAMELFELLDRFDLAYCHAPWRFPPGEINNDKGIPECFPEANSGVLVYNACDDFKNLVDKWEEIYTSQSASGQPRKRDQPAFRQALFYSPIKSYVLPPEYNIRTPMPVFRGGGLKAKILHGRGSSLDRAAAEINNVDGVVVFDFRK